MDEIILKEIKFSGITLQVPDQWRHKTEEFKDEDGTKSYGIAVSGRGRDVRSINLSWGEMPEGTNAYTEACITYEQVVGEVDLSETEDVIMSFGFQGHEAHGFNVYSENSIPCFFFCQDTPSKGKNHLLTVLVSAPNHEELQNLIDFVEEYLKVE